MTENKTEKKRISKKILIPAVAAVAVLGIGGVALATTLGDDDELTGKTLDRASQAALEHVGEGTVTGAERNDDGGDPEVYEIEVTRADGSEVDVLLDEDYAVIAESDDRADGDRDDDRDDTDQDDSDQDDAGQDDADDTDGTDGRDRDDRALTAAERTSAEKAARAEVPGTVVDVDASDDVIHGEPAAYEVDVTARNGAEWTVWLDGDYAVISKSQDD